MLQPSPAQFPRNTAPPSTHPPTHPTPPPGPLEPLQGSLQEQLIYPLPATAERRIPDDQLRQLLRTVDLEHLLDRWRGGARPPSAQRLG